MRRQSTDPASAPTALAVQDNVTSRHDRCCCHSSPAQSMQAQLRRRPAFFWAIKVLPKPRQATRPLCNDTVRQAVATAATAPRGTGPWVYIPPPQTTEHIPPQLIPAPFLGRHSSMCGRSAAAAAASCTGSSGGRPYHPSTTYA